MAAPERPVRVYAIGDIHGRLAALRAVHDRIEQDLAERPAGGPHLILHIGDYVDRGPDSREVVELLATGCAAGAPWLCLFGNHDRMMLCFLDEPGGRDPRLNPAFYWLHDRLGGAATLRSYGVAAPDGISEEEGAALRGAFMAAVPPAHRSFLSSLPRSWRWGDWFFAHAGVAPGAPLAAQTEDDLIWIRAEFLECRLDYGATIVHGHTPVDAVEDHGNRIAIDTGAAYGGPLSCVVLEGTSARVLGGRVLR